MAHVPIYMDIGAPIFIPADEALAVRADAVMRAGYRFEGVWQKPDYSVRSVLMKDGEEIAFRKSARNLAAVTPMLMELLVTAEVRMNLEKADA